MTQVKGQKSKAVMEDLSQAAWEFKQTWCVKRSTVIIHVTFDPKAGGTTM